MTRDRRSARLGVVLVGLGALIAVVALASGHPIGGHGSENRRAVGVVVSVVAAAVLGGVMLVWALVAGGVRFSRRQRDPDEPVVVLPPLSRWWLLLPLGMVAGLITLLVLSAHRRVHRHQLTTVSGLAAKLPAHSSSGSQANLTLVVVAAVVGAIAAALTAVVLRRRARQHRRKPGGDETLRHAVVQAEADLDWSDDPRVAVLRAYARMETALASSGVARRQSEAPREYLSRALAVAGVGGAAERLTSHFEEARYSPHEIGESVRADAREALGEVRRQLEPERADRTAPS